jgi:hypothetical protein
MRRCWMLNRPCITSVGTARRITPGPKSWHRLSREEYSRLREISFGLDRRCHVFGRGQPHKRHGSRRPSRSSPPRTRPQRLVRNGPRPRVGSKPTHHQRCARGQGDCPEIRGVHRQGAGTGAAQDGPSTLWSSEGTRESASCCRQQKELLPVSAGDPSVQEVVLRRRVRFP